MRKLLIVLVLALSIAIGVIAQVPNIKGLYDKLGIDMEVFKAGKYKDMYVGIRKLTAEERMLMQEITDQLYEQFIEAVAEGRGLSREEVVELATGQLYTGEQAKELGLVDELGGINAAIDLAASLAGIEEPKVEYYKREAPSLLDYIVGMNWQRLQSL